MVKLPSFADLKKSASNLLDSAKASIESVGESLQKDTNIDLKVAVNNVKLLRDSVKKMTLTNLTEDQIAILKRMDFQLKCIEEALSITDKGETNEK